MKLWKRHLSGVIEIFCILISSDTTVSKLKQREVTLCEPHLNKPDLKESKRKTSLSLDFPGG